MLPPAPARFSTTTDWPRFSVSFFATMRAAVSVPPPGAKPTVRVTGRVGKFCCAEAMPAAASAAARQILAMWCMFASSLESVVRYPVSVYVPDAMDFSRDFDLLILGGGNAALCAALTARGHGLSVLVLESAPVHFRGGNSRHTRNIRTMHSAPLEPLVDAYPEDEYWQDLLKVTGGLTDERLA